MSFNTALSGLNAASIDLNVTSNNIANVSTTGFKSAKVEFGDYFQITPFGTSQTAVGAGVKVNNIAQNFGQGNLEFTDSGLDLAISGDGFFILNDDLTAGEITYTRAGQFSVDANGYIANSQGRYLQTYPTDALGNVTSTSINTLVPLQLQTTTGAPQATTEVEVGVNLDATTAANRLDPGAFNPADAGTYHHSTATTVFDSLGTSHILSYYFVNDTVNATTNPAPGTDNQWVVFPFLDGVAIDFDDAAAVTVAGQDAAILNFNADGSFAGSTPAAGSLGTTITAGVAPLTNGAATLVIEHDFANNSPTQFASNFSVAVLQQDGFATGRLTGLDIGEEGLIQASYSNGRQVPLGQIAFATFPSEQGLQDVGDAQWVETVDSGQVLTGIPGSGSLGRIQSGALEASNVDLTEQLVNLIIAQRNFQANARSIETNNTITDTVIQIR